MESLRDYRHVPARLKGASLALGNFDGVHRGHQVVLQAAIDAAKPHQALAGAMVFEPHPRRFFHPGRPFFDLTTLEVKQHLLADFGLDLAVALPFDAELADMSADRFIEEVLVAGLGVSHIVTGYDFSYGKGRSGNIETLRVAGEKHGFGVTIIKPVTENGHEVISSSGVRAALRAGNPREAAGLLGHWWSVAGKVKKGHGRGRSMGYPTANIHLHEGCEPKIGIYAVRVFLSDAGGANMKRINGAAYFGASPTFGGIEPLLEPFLFDFDGDLYGHHIEVEFIDYLRGDAKFENMDDLKRQIEADCRRAREVLAELETRDPMLQYPLGRRRERLLRADQ
ncbi:MAG TPA: bifunctional riboflavin kinase/FAD synthetase [Rhizobiales bacterium]|nr:bifunctional riboflavin kinase/FAD synthetase [Hyphomicrobiales bacterium]